jgi:lipoyl-dependent peroxiredoxin
MPTFNRKATAGWSGNLANGSGTTSTETGALKDVGLNFKSRFTDEDHVNTNPEELIAAAQASCFSMALANSLSQQGHVPESIHTTATVTMDLGEGGANITKMHLVTEGKVPGIDQEAFQQAAEGTKQNCPVSKLLNPGLQEVTLEARLLS